jgi:lysosomal acid phosphatase
MRGRSLLAFCAILAIASLVSSARTFERKLKADINTLELVQILFRHGDRTPITQYPKDPLQNASLWFPYADGFEALTKKGRQMHYEVGQYWRSRYEGFLSDVYSPQEIFVQSSDADRAIMSCLADLAGLWPPSSKDPKSQWNSKLAWQPIPIHTIPKKLDNFINFGADCPRFKELKAEYIKRSPFARTINEDPENKQLFAYLSQHTGLEVTDFETVSDLYDTIKIQKSYGMAVPAWVESVYPQMEKLAPLFFDPRVIVPNDEAKRVKAGPLLSFLVKNMDVKRDSPALSKAEKDAHRKAKFYMVSGHDTTGSIALGAINVFETQFPPYASTAIFEMHKGRKNQREDNIGDHFVRVFFRNGTALTDAPYEFEIPKCGYPCKLDTFKELFGSIMIEGEEWEKACVAGGAAAAGNTRNTRPRPSANHNNKGPAPRTRSQTRQ